MSEYPYKTSDLALEFKCHPKTVLRKAAQLRIGIDLGGRAGKRYSEDDRRTFIESLKPDAPIARKRRRTAVRT